MTEFKLGDWTIHPDSNEMIKGGQSTKLTSRVMEVLIYFCKNPLRVISRDELIEAVWGKVALSPNSLNVAIGSLRQALGDDALEPKYLETVQKRGYRLLIESSFPTTKPTYLTKILKTFALMIGIFTIIYGAFLLLPTTPEPVSSTILISFVGIENDTGSDDYNQLSTSLGDLLIVELAQEKDLRVRKETSLENLSNKDFSDQYLAENLALTGKLIKTNEQLSLTMFLHDVKTDDVRWAITQDINNGLSFRSIASLTHNLLTTLGRRNDPITFVLSPEHQEAKELVDRALYLWGFHGHQTNKLAFNMVNRAIEIAPNYGPAYGLIANMYVLTGLPYWGLSGNKFDEALVKISKARELGAPEPFLLINEAWIQLRRDRRPDLASETLNRALELSPNDPWVLRHTTIIDPISGQFDKAIKSIERAAELSIDPAGLMFERLMYLYYNKQYDVVLNLYEKTIALDGQPFIGLMNTLTLTGQHESAIKGWLGILNSARSLDNKLSNKALLAYQNGSLKEAYEILQNESGFKLELNNPRESFIIATWKLAVGDRQGALEALNLGSIAMIEQIKDIGLDGFWILLHVDPYFEDLRNEPKMIETLDRLGIVQYHN